MVDMAEDSSMTFQNALHRSSENLVPKTGNNLIIQIWEGASHTKGKRNESKNEKMASVGGNLGRTCSPRASVSTAMQQKEA
ncbi:hypothetical protein Fmac_011148 [Flemingia macrophylla]|uniref:Uncharacterized protein n=1 Tax=Flemingia macrophylla TaxID=520843 RepID=A0ABD1MLL2_9FABA